MPNRLIDLPPLDLLRTFVAVGRRMSITLAAQDLCIVQSAVSRQIQALETALDCRLFVRAYRCIEFTPEGRHLFRSADPMLEQLGSVIGSLHPAGERPCITITATIGVTALWLLPRLGAFQRRAPDIDVRVAATNCASVAARRSAFVASPACTRSTLNTRTPSSTSDSNSCASAVFSISSSPCSR